MVVSSFTSILTHGANIFEPLSCVKPSEAQINVYTQSKKKKKKKVGTPMLILGGKIIMKKNQKIEELQLHLQNLS